MNEKSKAANVSSLESSGKTFSSIWINGNSTRAKIMAQTLMSDQEAIFEILMRGGD